ncbi:hypothetical protein FRC08_005479 [Ceratobasidium sp. 394]|nr:hypothetical protein FRC08_005479 [Ceratobasidium sp. 394]
MVTTRRNANANPESIITKEDDTPKDKRDLGEDESIDGNTSSEHDDALVPGKKRARSGRAPVNNSRKKYVRGKQGGLKGLMKMPVEIFTEIAYLLNPGDLISLARSNKFFRKMLLKRSSAQIWQRAESNVPGLPPCPAGICEPQYAALVFSKYCTLCGASAPSNPDLDLRVRLCNSCRDTEVEVISRKRDRLDLDLTLVHYSLRTRPKKNKSQPRIPVDAIFVMRNEIDEILEKRGEFRHAKDQRGLAQWDRERRVEVLARRMHAGRVFDYLKETEASREEDLESMKQQRRETIFERLKALGWTDEDLEFEGPELKPWRVVVDAPKPLTDRVWTNILPKLTQMLEENRERHIVSAKKKRRIERRARIDKFLLDMRYTEHPFEPIFGALGVPTPPPPDVGGDVGMLRLLVFSTALPETPNPFPKTQTALKWGCLRDLDEPEIDIEEVAARLEERKAQIEEKALEWRTLVEQRLVEKFEAQADQIDEDVVLTVAGSTDSTMQLPRNTRLLLRADTLFSQEGSNTNSAPFMSYEGRPPCYYPNFVSSFYDGLEESESYTGSDTGQETDLERYTRDTETERIVKPLLRELGMQDASHIELGVFKSRFTCGRCKSGKPKKWKDLVKHYVLELKLWASQNDAHDDRIRYPIVVRNVHDTESMNNPKPLVHLLAEEEASQTDDSGSNSPSSSAPGRPRCYLCEATGRSDVRMGREDILAHAREVHDVVAPIDGLHYGDAPNLKWHDVWNEFHDVHIPPDPESPSVES